MSIAESVEIQKAPAAKLVDGRRRSNALYRHFGSAFIEVESLVYRYLDTIASAYSGGFFDFYEIEGGGFYLSLRTDEVFKVEVPFGNHFSAELSADALSIVACLFVYCHMGNTDQRCVNHYHKLRDFALGHAEAALILAAID
ncbi:antirestriction protein [Marinagarivorans cellulosilyticus]|uniref:Antirestriction protein n=1 Tax=Marinagarivorans cellulosilyticus TaxID=2721545 RepID=A0AAN1WHM0_9GAMM|nr:antirestriction protein [Marinagarivorans cellulosilyticus]BCD97685.1 hypothetical protein MARGE09_P1886 [Marinagarivorans cellulosilyticus]